MNKCKMFAQYQADSEKVQSKHNYNDVETVTELIIFLIKLYGFAEESKQES